MPSPAVVALVGIAGCGKSTFAQGSFKATEILSSDRCRALICDDENEQSVSADAFSLLFKIAELRLKSGKRVVIDATNTLSVHRQQIAALARNYGSPTLAIVFDYALDVCLTRNEQRHRVVATNVIERQYAQLQQELANIESDGFSSVHILRSPDESRSVRVTLL